MINFEEAEIRSRIIKSLAHPVRLMIVEMLKEGECPFSHINGFFDNDKSTVSKHLSVLKDAGIVCSRKIGVDMIYKLEVPCITDFFGCVNAVLENTVNRQQACLKKK